MSGLVVLVSCVKSKRDHPRRAGDMYTSTLFRKMMAYVEHLNPRSTFILSAKYGLLHPDTVIEPYEQTLKRMKARDRETWAHDVLSALGQTCDLETDQFVFLAGEPYRRDLVPHIKHYAAPMDGLSLGRQLQWLQEQVS
jgi:hypothetical protein